jgi:carbamate kinase
MRVLVALGGSALLRRGESAEAAAQRRDVMAAAEVLAGVAGEHEVVLTHGDGPQVGPPALRNDGHGPASPYPLAVLGAESEGMIGYMLELALRNALPDRDLITVLSEVVVVAEDPAFGTPTRPIGPIYSAEEAKRLTAERGWSIGPDGAGFRRLLPSPEPQAIVELRSLRVLLDSGVLVICAGGGGIPVTLDGDGTMRGVEAVVDKDLTAALLARRLDADVLVMLTDADGVHLDHRGERERGLGRVTPAELRRHDFASGSMSAKVDAACRFVEATGRRAAIGDLTKAVEMVRGESGTQISAASA